MLPSVRSTITVTAANYNTLKAGEEPVIVVVGKISPGLSPIGRSPTSRFGYGASFGSSAATTPTLADSTLSSPTLKVPGFSGASLSSLNLVVPGGGAASLDAHIHSRLLPLLEVINRATTLVPGRLDVYSGNLRVDLSTWKEGLKDVTDRPANWEELSRSETSVE